MDFFAEFREIGQKSSEELVREGSGVKAFSSFLSELSSLVPELIIPNISVLITHLDGEVRPNTHVATVTSVTIIVKMVPVCPATFLLLLLLYSATQNVTCLIGPKLRRQIGIHCAWHWLSAWLTCSPPSAVIQSHNMRVAVCEVLGDILVRVLCGDALDESGKADRDRFLDTLQEHLHDTHSHVRARVLQAYTRIVNSKVGLSPKSHRPDQCSF